MTMETLDSLYRFILAKGLVKNRQEFDELLDAAIEYGLVEVSKLDEIDRLPPKASDEPTE